jgi:hypothetical protein
MKKTFDNLMLIGRAAAGKSEFIDFLKKIPEPQREEKYHIGHFEEMDDFPWLYAMLKDEDLWEQLGRSRNLASRRENVYITKDYDVYRFLTLKFNQQVAKRLFEEPKFYEHKTLFIEYARGREDAYKIALNLLDKDILKRTAIFYLDNTFEESLRRNTVRSTDSDAKQTILHHKTPLEVMEYYYRTHDWHELTGKKESGYIEIKGIKMPFVTVWNIPESHDFHILEKRYGPALKRLWELYDDKKTV